MPDEPDVPEDEPAAPGHAAVEGPEEGLEPVREQSHEEAGRSDRLAEIEARAQDLEARAQESEARLAEREAAWEEARAKDATERDAREKDLVERLQRLQADFENFRRRTRDESTLAAGRGKESLLKAILPVLDNLDRALEHAEDEGLKLLARQLHAVLVQEGIVVVSPEGEAFDANVHEAIAREEGGDAKEGTVLKVVEKGYMLDGRVLRPARVIVAA